MIAKYSIQKPATGQTKASIRGIREIFQEQSLVGWFLISAGAILVLAGCEQIRLVVEKKQVLGFNDPIFGISFRLVFVSIGIINLVCGVFCLFTTRKTLLLGLTAWLSLNALVYWIGMWIMGWSSPFPITAHLTVLWGIPPGLAGFSHALAVFYLLAGSISCLVALSRAEKDKDYIKMSCPSCGGHIQFAERNLGRKQDCPHCSTVLTLRRADETLKMSCFFCQGHVQFPSHALGTKMPCPHCKKDITLVEPK